METQNDVATEVTGLESDDRTKIPPRDLVSYRSSVLDTARMELIKTWLKRHLSNPQVVILGVLLLVGFIVIAFLGNMLTPFFGAVVIAYLLDGIIVRFQKRGFPRLVAVIIVFLFFMVTIFTIFFGLVPTMVQQLDGFIRNDVPKIVETVSSDIAALDQRYQNFKKDRIGSIFQTDKKSEDAEGSESSTDTTEETETSDNQETQNASSESPPTSNGSIESTLNGPLVVEGEGWTAAIETELTNFGRAMIKTSFNSLRSVVVWVVYLVLVPVLVFFLLKDKERILRWFGRFLPKDRALANRVWTDVNLQTSNYVRGKFWEIIIVWGFTHVTFTLFGLKAALLLSLVVGLSVLVPYVGATVMYIPISVIAFYQFGWGSQFFWILVAYTIIQVLDGNVLVPILLSEVTNLHPIAIIVAILVFGGIWGFWGVFFAVPLATLVNAVINAWPKDFQAVSADPPNSTKVSPAKNLEAKRTAA